jgi:lysophospholipase L1-like esterase
MKKDYHGKYDFYQGPSRARKALYALMAVVIFFAAIEVILRAFDFGFYVNFSADLLGMPLLDMTSFRRVTNRTVEFDPHLFWSFKPNQMLDSKGIYRKPVIINSLGFRGREFSEKKPEGVFRIICLGDSSTFGWSVGEDETYPYHLERFLNEKYPLLRFEVLNLGVTGYTSRQGRELFCRKAVNYQPDMVIFAFGPNDRLPSLKSDAEHLEDKTWAMSQAQVFLNRIQLYKLLKSGVIYLENRARGMSLEPGTFIHRLKRKVNQDEFRDNAERVKKLCEQRGAGFILVNVDYPSEPMDSATRVLKEEAMKAGVGIPLEWNFWDSSGLISETAQDLDVPAIDLREIFSGYLELLRTGQGDRERALAKQEQMGELVEKEPWRYLMIDNGHPNKWGHEVIAEALLEEVASHPVFKSFLEKQGIQ